MIEWRFKPNSRDDMDVDPIQGEFFTTRDIDNISTAVVREGIQNALDERNREGQSETVKVRIFLSGDKYALNKEEYLPLIEGLIPHLKAQKPPISTLPAFTGKMNFFVFEDFNTRGLEGNPEEGYIENNNDRSPHNFYYFWRNVGRSGKTDDKLGRWGLGKTVFPASSRISTFWGLTVRRNDQKKMLMGQSILRIHNRQDEKWEECGYRPYGMYGNYKDNKFFANPIEDANETNNFESLFRLDRKSQPGLSLIIPFCSEDITINHLAYSVIEQYFYPILEGKLQVEITEEDNVITLDKNTMQESIDKLDFQLLANGDERKIRSKESLMKLFDFAKWTFQLKEEDFYKLTPLDISLKPRWNKSLFQNEELLKIAREKFETGDRVAFKIPLRYQTVNEAAKICWYDAFLEKDPVLIKPENLFVRDGITISGISSMDKGLVRGLVVIHDTDLARMLGDSENPAHTEWQPDSRNFKGKYVHDKETLVFVKSTLKKIYDQLQRPVEGMQKDLLIDFFSIPVKIKEVKTSKDLPKSKDLGQDDVVGPDLTDINGKKRPMLIERIPSGLKISKNPDAEDLPDSVRISLGYDVPRGNPVKSYQELDFDVSKPPIVMESSGVYFTKKEFNVLEFDIENKSQFEIVLKGFDEKRDLFVKM